MKTVINKFNSFQFRCLLSAKNKIAQESMSIRMYIIDRMCVSRMKEKKNKLRDWNNRRCLPDWLFELLVIRFDEFV